MILNVSAYKFVALEKVKTLQVLLKAKGDELDIKGTILLADEGINMNLAGDTGSVQAFEAYLETFPEFIDLPYKDSYSKEAPFSKFVVSIKPEIVTMKDESVHAGVEPTKHIDPEEFKQWLDEGRDIKVLDTRNEFEVEFGTFKNAEELHIEKFSEFPEAIKHLDAEWKKKPVVMFCTGGIRCEKAALAMQHEGYDKVYQLAGGILKYFEKCKDAHWKGECFVFDDRVAVNGDLEETGVKQCKQCFMPVDQAAQVSKDYVEGVSCSRCVQWKKRACDERAES